MATHRLGIWLLGARGRLATTAAVGLAALQKKRVEPTALVSELPYFADLHLPSWDEMIVGGYDLVERPLVETATELVKRGVLSAELVESARKTLQRWEKNIGWGVSRGLTDDVTPAQAALTANEGETPQQSVARVQHDLREFVRRSKLDQLIVINVATPETPVDEKTLPRRWTELESRLTAAEGCPLAASSLYAIAALDAGFPYLNLTPSLGSKPVAINELAVARETCHMGQDANPAGILAMSVLAPTLARLNLRVTGWVGQRIGGPQPRDRTTRGPQPAVTGDQTSVIAPLLGQLLGYQPPLSVATAELEAAAHCQTAVDQIHVQGFMNTPMTLDFRWHGYESIWLAPAILDLARLTAHACRQGTHGRLEFLSCFFREPLGVRDIDFVTRYQKLVEWVRKAS